MPVALHLSPLEAFRHPALHHQLAKPEDIPIIDGASISDRIPLSLPTLTDLSRPNESRRLARSDPVLLHTISAQCV